MFDVTDKLVGTLLDGLSGTHLLFGSLSVESDPAGATVSVNGKEVGTAPLSVRGLPAGAVQVSARLAGHEEVNTSVTITDGESTDAPLSLARSTGTLALTVPKDAVVTVSSAEIGKKDLTGLVAATLPTGDYDVQASCAGMPVVSGKVSITRGANTPYLPWPKGYLDVQAVPAGATIVVDGVERGVAPLVVDVEPGTLHHVELKLAKYQAYVSDIKGTAGDKTPLSGTLTPLPGSIRVETSIPDAYVELDESGQYGSTPFVFNNVEPGAHVVKIANVTVDKREYTVGDPINVDVGPAQDVVISKTFVAGKGILVVKDAPPESVVLVDGSPADSQKALSTGIELPAGSYELSVQAPSSQTWHVHTFIGSGNTSIRSIYGMLWDIPRRTIKIDGKTDDWADLLPAWVSGQNYNAWAGQTGTQIQRGYVCRDDKYLYFRYDFSNGTPQSKINAKEIKDLEYVQIMGIKDGELTAIIRYTAYGQQTILGVQSSKRVWTDMGTGWITFKAGENTLEIAISLTPIKSRLKGPPATSTLYVVNANPTPDHNWISRNASETQGIDFGL